MMLEKELWEDDEDEGNLAYLSASDAYRITPDESERLRRMSYVDYRRTTHWITTKQRALLRAGRQCQLCEGRNRRLDVHHLTYARFGREAEADLIVLCSFCHTWVHDKPDREFVLRWLDLPLFRRVAEQNSVTYWAGYLRSLGIGDKDQPLL